jgi:serine/threonine protein kinase
MSFTPPTAEQIRQSFPQITEAHFLKQGGFKAVYRVAIGGRAEAFKLVNIPRLPQPDLAEQFRVESLGRIKREVQVLGSCRSPVLVKLGGIAPCEVQMAGLDFVAYSEEFLAGEDLRKMIQANARPSEAELRQLLTCLLKAIRELWSLPGRFIHRDIKPDNVMRLSDPSRPFVLLDLGIAFSVFDTPLTFDAQNRMPPGTFRYLAPEMLQLDFQETLDFRSDVYAAGLTVFEFAAGQHPLAQNRDDLLTTLSRITKETPKALKDFRPDLAPWFCQMVNRMLKKLPALRPANLDALIARLEETE